MPSPLLSKLSGMVNRTPVDVVGIDCASNGLRAIRMRRVSGGFQVAAAEVLTAPPEHLATLAGLVDPDPDKIEKLDLPLRLRGRSAALTFPALRSFAKLIRTPDRFDVEDRAQLMSRLGCEKVEDLRSGYIILQPAAARVEGRVLAVAVPDAQAVAALNLLPAIGHPVPGGIGLSEVAVVNAFRRDLDVDAEEQGIGIIHFDHDFTLFALFNKGMLSQLRTFPSGASSTLKLVSEKLGVDEATAEGVLTDGAFDLSHVLGDTTRDIASQFILCRDFMERSENCRLKNLHVSGPEALTKSFVEGLHGSVPVAGWNALHGFDIPEGTIPEALEKTPWRFAAAVGACTGLMEGA